MKKKGELTVNVTTTLSVELNDEDVRCAVKEWLAKRVPGEHEWDIHLGVTPNSDHVHDDGNCDYVPYISATASVNGKEKR